MPRTLAASMGLLFWCMLVILQSVPAKAEEQSEGARLREESILLLQQRETAQAKELADQALAWAKTQFGQEHIEIAEALLLLAAFESGDDRRRAAAREATAMAERVLGPRHGRLVFFLCNLATLEGLGAETLPLIDRALAIARDAYGEGHEELRRAAVTKFMALSVQRRFDEARDVEKIYGLDTSPPSE